MTSLLFWARTLKGSVIAFAVVLVLGFVGMGLLGAGLYYAVSPVLGLRFPPIDEWQGDWVWP
ncbi:MAG TPA: hypothetical protein VF576_07615, partial [Rubricoccaceae bacterium]